MAVEKTKNTRKKSAPNEASESTKKGIKKSSEIKVLKKKIDFSNWLELFGNGIQADKLAEAIPHLSIEFQNLSSELIKAISDSSIKPTSKFKIEKIPSAFLKVLAGKTINPFYLIVLLCSPVTELELKKQIIIKLSSHSLSQEDFEYFLNRVTSIKDQLNKQFIWNEFLSNDVLLKESWQPHQLRWLEWGFSQELRITRPQEVFIAFRSAAEQFKDIETPHRNRIYRKLLETDILAFIVFMLHISTDTSNLKFTEQIIGKKNVDVLLVYLENRQFLAGPWLEIFEQQFIAPTLRDTLDRVMNFEELLPFLLKASQMSHLVAPDTLSRAVNRSFKRDDLLSNLLRDVRVDQLTYQVEILAEENSQLLNELNSERTRIQENEKRIRDFEVAINGYESRLRSQMMSENLGSDAMAQSAKVEVIKSLVDGLDYLLHGSEGFAIERALQKIGITKLGDPGSIFTWDPELCESLTGVAIEKGFVIRSGYTWLNGDKKVVIRRVLLKLA